MIGVGIALDVREFDLVHRIRGERRSEVPLEGLIALVFRVHARDVLAYDVGAIML